MSRGRKILLALAVTVLLVGIGVMLFPYFQQWRYDRGVRDWADSFDAWRQEMREQAEQDAPETEAETDSIPYLQDLYAAMQAYNEDIYENGQSGFRDAWSYQVPSFDLTEWGLEDNMVGYIDIPRMGVKLPIYLGASTANMRLGAVHLSQTSLPIGGENTNAVIAAHRGYSTAAMFRDIQKLQIGDEITITNLWETLTYRVTETRVIKPTDTQEVLIQEGRDMVTLITCHPYRVSTHRYVVYCERVV